jgi:hypothetical protein
MAAMTHPLIDEAMKKAAIAWVAVGDAPARALWCLPADDALWVVSGPGEQEMPGLATHTHARVTMRGDHGGRVVTWPVVVAMIEPGSEQWEQVVPQLAGKRLNAAGTAEEVAARWAAECTVSRLTPSGEPLEAGDTLPDGSLSAPPRETPARRTTRRPFRLHRVRRPR